MFKGRKLYKCPPTDLRGFDGNEGEEIQYAVTYVYNGGISVGGEWYDGYEVPPPIIPAGMCIVGIGVGLQLNARPPYATARIKPLTDLHPGQSYMDLDGVWKKKPEAV